MDLRETRYHHAKCLGLVHPSENLSSHSFKFIRNFVGQREYKGSVDTLKWNIQPRAVIERHNLRLCRLGFEIHDDVFGQGVLISDFQHRKKLVEMGFGEFGIHREAELSPLLCWSNDSALRSGYCLLWWGHVPTFS